MPGDDFVGSEDFAPQMTMAGGVVMSGAATLSRTRAYTPSGGIVLTGSSSGSYLTQGDVPTLPSDPGPGDPSLDGSLQGWAPTWLIDLSTAVDRVLTDTVDEDTFEEDVFDTDPSITPRAYRFATIDLDVQPPPDEDPDGTIRGPYFGRILDRPSIDRRLMDTFWGLTEVTEVSFSLNNTDDVVTLLSERDLRGTPVIIRRYDWIAQTIVETFTAVITQVQRFVDRIRVSASSPDLTAFERIVPSQVIKGENMAPAAGVTLANFGKNIADAGAVIPVIFGSVTRIPLPYIRDNVAQNHYDYMVGHGALTVDTVYRDRPDGSLEGVDSTEYVVSTTRYNGYTTIRFLIRQINFGNSLHKIYADVTGPITNFARAVQEVLTNTTWGLSQTVDEDSFDEAAGVLDDLELLCDGVMLDQRRAQDVLSELLAVRGLRLGVNLEGLWTLTADVEQTSISLVALEDGDDNSTNIVKAGPRERPHARNAVTDYVLKYWRDPLKDEFVFEQHRTLGLFGSQKVIENNFIRDHVTADKVTDYQAKRLNFGSDSCALTLEQSARRLKIGDLIILTYAPLGYDHEIVEVVSVEKSLETIEVLIASWDPVIYEYTEGVLPGDSDFDPFGPGINLKTARIPRPGGLELLGPATQAISASGRPMPNLVGQANSRFFIGPNIRVRWHAVAILPEKNGFDEDDISAGMQYVRDYLVTVFAIQNEHALDVNQTEVDLTVTEVGHGPFPITGADLPYVVATITAKTLIENWFDFVPSPPTTLTIWFDPALGTPAVNDTGTWTIALWGNTLFNAWVRIPFPESFLVATGNPPL